MKSKLVPLFPGSETITSIRWQCQVVGCWCQGGGEVRPGLQPTAQGPCLDKWDKWPSHAVTGPGLVSNESSWHRQKTSQNLLAAWLGASTDFSARLFFQENHCTISKFAMSFSMAKSTTTRMFSWPFPIFSESPSQFFQHGFWGVVISC